MFIEIDIYIHINCIFSYNIIVCFINIYNHVGSFACMFEWSLSIELCGRIRYI